MESKINYKELLIVSGSVYAYTDGKEKKCLRKREAETLFHTWKDAGKKIHRRYGMGGKVNYIWIDE